LKAFWGEPPAAAGAGEISIPGAARLSLFLPTAALALLTVAGGLLAGPLVELALAAAAQLLEPAGYVRAVLGGRT
jgi:multicomponent Na+:H+ antiporter subunit D